jgi:hypothetical protein
MPTFTLTVDNFQIDTPGTQPCRWRVCALIERRASEPLSRRPRTSGRWCPGEDRRPTRFGLGPAGDTTGIHAALPVPDTTTSALSMAPSETSTGHRQPNTTRSGRCLSQNLSRCRCGLRTRMSLVRGLWRRSDPLRGRCSVTGARRRRPSCHPPPGSRRDELHDGPRRRRPRRTDGQALVCHRGHFEGLEDHRTSPRLSPPDRVPASRSPRVARLRARSGTTLPKKDLRTVSSVRRIGSEGYGDESHA